ncbi:SIMPL domain-containing protein [Solilutibacter silvestris]|uniref:SIMPL domain-containing protein n=1 Tax=Solilutibacter silvestris TaxID=1645665 RepID=UPI003D3339E6
MRVMLMAGLLAVAGVANAGTPLPDGPHVVTSGEGKVSVAPDMVTLHVSVTKRNPIAANAKQEADQAVNRFLEALAKQGVENADITASGLDLSEDTERADSGRRVSNGYTAERSIEVKLRALDRFNAVLDAALTAGINGFGNPTFESSRKTELMAQARALAAQDAQRKAEDLARGFSAHAGRIYSIDSVGSSTGERYLGRGELGTVTVTRSKTAPARYLQPQIEYRERVQAVFDLQR